MFSDNTIDLSSKSQTHFFISPIYFLGKNAEFYAF